MTSFACLAVAALVWVACDDGGAQSPAEELPEEYAHFPPTAVLSTVMNLRSDLLAVRHPSDGGGRAWLEDGPTEVRISSRHTWTIVYEAGPLGVAEGGMVYFMTSPFWGWGDAPQTRYADGPGYVELSTDAADVELIGIELNENALGIEIGGRALREGERVRIVYGAGTGAISDRYYERGASFWVSVDGDGDRSPAR